MRNIRLYFNPESEELVLLIKGLTVKERVRSYRLLQKFFDHLAFRSFVSVDSTGVPDALILFLR